MAATGRRAVEHRAPAGVPSAKGIRPLGRQCRRPSSNTASLGDEGVKEMLVMTKDASFKKVVRRHAEETGQRYTEALTDLEGLGARMHHEPVPERLLAHLRDRYGVDPVAATKLRVHKTYVFRVDRKDGSTWVAREFTPARPRAGGDGDAEVHGFLA